VSEVRNPGADEQPGTPCINQPADACCPFCGSKEIKSGNELSGIRPLWKGYLLFGVMGLSLLVLSLLFVYMYAEGQFLIFKIDERDFKKNVGFYLVIYLVIGVPLIGLFLGVFAHILNPSFVCKCCDCKKQWAVPFSLKKFWKEFFQKSDGS
jgi:hypothetical protein